ncbi:leukemia inhibitory factor receptor isoform X2 [Stegastes partitus]|uniref:Leukemia inhibitory factor receptor isoform X2 n=2 Tax=Stegastes partitus TaxID=144197 RepID=A0A9Y4K5Z1_9TELE|nr:PREDICTED: leukemia inhibitory factor receptor-like isoform X2 [Stegastes partitus]
MTSVRISFISLLGLHLIFSVDYSKCSVDTVWQRAKPSISHLKAVSDRQSLMVSWPVNHSGLVDEVYELQIGRTEKQTIVYTTNVTVSSGGSHEHTWTWISDLPLECVDHSVRIRHLYNQSVPSPWSNWTTNPGFKSKDMSEIFPAEQVLREGSNPKFCCVPAVGVNITQMTFRNQPYPLESIGDRVKAISVKNLEIPEGLYKFVIIVCSSTTGKIEYASNDVSFPPQKPVNLSCSTSDMKTVKCTWDVTRKQDQFDPNERQHTLHIQNSGRAPIRCKLSQCTFTAVPQLQEYNIRVVVKDKLGEEAESYSFNISDRVFPVVELTRVSPGVTDVSLSWTVQGNLAQMNPVCQVSTVPGRTTELNCNNASGLCEVRLEHLLPNTDYYTSVRCSVNGRLWGKWTRSISFTTDPLVTLDLWRRIQPLSHSDSRQVTLLWNPHVVGTAATVKVQGYTVQWSQEGQNWTDRRDGGQNRAEVSIGPGRCDFTVQAVLHTGSSIPSHVTVPPTNQAEKPPVQKRLSSTAAGGFSLSWDQQSTCGYTVEWCILGNAVPCTLQWLKVPAGNNTLLLPAGHFKAGLRYTFSIYGCTDDGHKLLETQTGYSEELKSVQTPHAVEHVRSTSSSVTLEWLYNEDDPAQPAFITGYLVTVQEAGSDTMPDLFNVSVADPSKKSVTIEDLQPNQQYVCSVSAQTKAGPGPSASITIRTTVNYSAHLAKILAPVLLLLGCTVLLWPQRKMLKEIFAYPTGMNIKTPEFDSFLNETDRRLRSQKAEVCVSCDIEIVTTRSPVRETTPLTDPELTDMPCSPGSGSSPSSTTPSRVPLQADYCPQSALLHWDRPTPQPAMSITNKSYLYAAVEDYSEHQQVTSSGMKPGFEPSDCLQESCAVIYGYISNVT